jgi:rod shape-determining protein MreD
VAPAFFAATLLTLLVRAVAGGWPGWSMLVAPLAETLLWPVASLVLLAPQRRPPDPTRTAPVSRVPA